MEDKPVSYLVRNGVFFNDINDYSLEVKPAVVPNVAEETPLGAFGGAGEALCSELTGSKSGQGQAG